MHSPSGAPNFACRLASLLVESIESNLTMIGWIPWLIFFNDEPYPKTANVQSRACAADSVQKNAPFDLTNDALVRLYPKY